LFIFSISLFSICACTKKSVINTAVPLSAQFLGNYSVNEKGNSNAASQYAISITSGDNSSDLFIKNFNNYFTTPVKAQIIGDSIYIPGQTLEGRTIFGVGYLASNSTSGKGSSIIMSYEVLDPNSTIVACYGYNNTSTSQWSK